MSRENFHRLLQRYLDGRCTPEEEQLVDHWYQMLGQDIESAVTPNDLDTIEDMIWNKIQNRLAEIEHADTPPLHTRARRTRTWIVAASITALIVASATFLYYRVICYPVQPSFVETRAMEQDIHSVTNNTQETFTIFLPDESVVELFPGASIEYPSQFKQQREVRLIGDAIFNVEADLSNPFWVFHEGMITRVVGTKFRIKGPQGNTHGEVIVYTGQVDVFYNAADRSLIKRILSPPEKASLTANQRAALDGHSLAEAIVDNPVRVEQSTISAPREAYTDIPLPALAETLSALYALDVSADERLSDITFTGDISGLGFFEQLDIICTVTNSRYEVEGTTITITH